MEYSEMFVKIAIQVMNVYLGTWKNIAYSRSFANDEKECWKRDVEK